MRVIFIKDLKNQGKKGDIKEVKDGYAKNFLIKNGYAVAESKTSSKILKEDIKASDALDNKKRKEAKKLKAKLETEKHIYKLSAGKGGKVFGSVSAKMIVDNLKDYNIDKKKVKIEKQINTLGKHKVVIELYKEVKAEINIEVISG